LISKKVRKVNFSLPVEIVFIYWENCVKNIANRPPIDCNSYILIFNLRLTERGLGRLAVLKVNLTRRKTKSGLRDYI
jgi:hypothetical protein